jgi:Ca2+-binding RTX toxin-like protein
LHFAHIWCSWFSLLRVAHPKMLCPHFLENYMANFIVTSLDDTEIDDGVLTLREALVLANANADADTITFDAGLTDQTLLLTDGQLILSNSVTINGDTDSDGDADITISGGGQSRVFSVTNGTSTLNALTITNGSSSSGGGVDVGRSAYLIVNNSTFSGNTANSGGGLSSDGFVVIYNSTFSGNTADFGGGVFIDEGFAFLLNTTLSGNTALYGGGVFNRSATTELTNVTITGNTATITGNLSSGDSGGGVWAALPAGSLTLTDSIVLGNTAQNDNQISGPITYRDANITTGDAAAVFAVVDADGGGRLANNGGPVLTVALKADASNPALDISDKGEDATGAVPLDNVGVGNDGTNFGDVGALELYPAGLQVTILDDVVNALDGETSLREAIAYADRLNGADTITFAADLKGTITLAGTELILQSDVTINGDIDGDGDADITISGGGQFRVFKVTDGVSTLNALTITGGNSTEKGGGVFVGSSAALTVNNSTFSGNEASSGGGLASYGTVRINNSTFSGNEASSGGGLASYGTVRINNSTFSENDAVNDGGGVNIGYGSAELSNTTLSGNTAIRGGGISSDGTTDLTNVTIAGNTASGTTVSGKGGGVHIANRGDLTVNSSTFSGNEASYGGGLSSYGAVRINNSTFSGNEARSGGGVRIQQGSAELTNTTLSGNTAYNGGGITITSFGAADLTNVTITGNTASGQGGGIYTTFGSVSLINSIVLGNMARVSASNEIRDNGTITYRGGNIITGDSATVFADGKLRDNGGPVQTIALRADALNPAIDAGDDFEAPTTDATGAERFDVANVGNDDADFGDLGALELQQQSETLSLIVTTSDDVVDAFDNLTSLREALALANASDGADTITFDASVFTGTASENTITLAGSQLVLSSDVTIDGDIDGDNVADITVSGGGASRVFTVTGGIATLDALTITGGSPVSGSGGGGVNVYRDATLNLDNSTVSENYAGWGGGVYNDGTATLTNSTVSGNTARNIGGGIFNAYTTATLTLTDSTVSGNSATYGGGISNLGMTTLINSTVSRNEANYGGGIENQGTVTLTNSTLSGNLGDSGGGILNYGIATLTNSTLSGNTGGIANYDSSFGGRGDINSIEATTTLINSIVLGNSAAGAGNEETTGDGLIIIRNSITGENGETAADVFAEPDGTGGKLRDNGGPVQTIALRADALNPAIDAGDDFEAPTTDATGAERVDQSGVANNGSNRSDIGAYEARFASPTITSGTAASVAEGNTFVVNLATTDDLSSEGAGLTYAITGGRDSALFAINATSGVLQFVTAPDFEVPSDVGGNNVYEVSVTVTDAGGFTDTKAMIVSVSNVAEPTVGATPDNDDLVGTSSADRIDLLAGADRYYGLGGNDTVYGNVGNDRINGGDGADKLVGGSGSDVLNGGRGGDVLKSGGGSDVLKGGGGSDVLKGGGGSDVLKGGSGKDELTGGKGADSFIFNDGDSKNGFSKRDTITDFGRGNDNIDLRQTDADRGQRGDQSFDFSGTSAAENSVWYKTSGDNLIVMGDNTGDGVADFKITLLDVSNLSESDFLF